MNDIVERLRHLAVDYSQNSLDDEAWLSEAADEIERLRVALRDARECVHEWSAYASEYFQEKWDLAGDLARIDAELAK